MAEHGRARLIMDFTNKAGLLKWLEAARAGGLLGPPDSVGVFETTEGDRTRVGTEDTYITALRGTTEDRVEIIPRCPDDGIPTCSACGNECVGEFDGKLCLDCRNEASTTHSAKPR